MNALIRRQPGISFTIALVTASLILTLLARDWAGIIPRVGWLATALAWLATADRADRAETLLRTPWGTR